MNWKQTKPLDPITHLQEIQKTDQGISDEVSKIPEFRIQFLGLLKRGNQIFVVQTLPQQY